MISRIKLYLLIFIVVTYIILLIKVFTIYHKTEKISHEIEINYDILTLISNKQNAFSKTDDKNPTTIYAITPTYSRFTQKADLIRLSQTLRLVPNFHWILIEDANERSALVKGVIAESGLRVTQLNIDSDKLAKIVKNHRGLEQRNRGLQWLRENLIIGRDKGVVYFMDDDNTYDVKIFDEMRKIKKVGVWPVGLAGGLNVERPIVDSKTGKVTSFESGWKVERVFATDMAGFAINLDLILTSNTEFSYRMKKGYLEDEFLQSYVSLTDLEPLARNCTRVYVWHTKTEIPEISGVISEFEV